MAVASDSDGPSGAAPIRDAPLRGGRRAPWDYWELPGVEELSRPISAASPAIFGAAVLLGCDCQRGQETARNRHDSQQKLLQTRQPRLASRGWPPSRLILRRVTVHSPVSETGRGFVSVSPCLPGPVVTQSRHSSDSTDCERRTGTGRQRNARRLCRGRWVGETGPGNPWTAPPRCGTWPRSRAARSVGIGAAIGAAAGSKQASWSPQRAIA